MTYEDFNQWTGGVESLATIVALIVGAYWTYTRFVRQRDNFPLIEFTADIEFIGKHQDSWVVELTTTIENKGKVQHRISEFSFDLFALQKDDRLEPNSEFGGQIEFPHEVVKGSWLPKKFNYFFIDPSTKAKYSFLTRVPDSARFVILHSWFTYSDQAASHTAERTVRVPDEEPLLRSPNG
jgi:hypothetical protein